jgi:hypothetical protein
MAHDYASAAGIFQKDKVVRSEDGSRSTDSQLWIDQACRKGTMSRMVGSALAVAPRMTSRWMAFGAFLLLLAHVTAVAAPPGIDGEVFYLGVALNQEGAAGGWKQTGEAAGWKQTIAGAILHEKLFTVEDSGALYATDLRCGAWQQIGRAEFGNTKFMVSVGESLFTIETNGTLYRVNPANGRWARVGQDGIFGLTIGAVSLGGSIYTIESNGGLYVVDPHQGGWQQLGKADFADTRFFFASSHALFTIESTGTLYEVNPADGSWTQLGESGAWKNALGGAVLNDHLYTAEKDGHLYSTNLKTGKRRPVGAAAYDTTRFMFASVESLYTIETSGNLYHVNARPGLAIDEWDWCVEEVERLWQTQCGGMSHGFHSQKILGKAASRSGILDGFAWLQKQTKPGDLAVLYLGAHGSSNPQQGWSIITADAQTLWAADVKKALGQLPCRVLLFIETCQSGGFASAHPDGDPKVPANITALCACAENQTSMNPLDVALAEALYGRADFNHDGTVELDELIKYVELRYKEMWPEGGEGSNTPVIVRSPQMKGLGLTRPCKNICAVAVRNGFYSALDEGHSGSLHRIHVLGQSSRPQDSYYVANTASRDQLCLESDGPPLLVKRRGAWLPARETRVDGNTITVRLLGDHPAELTVKSAEVRYPFVGQGH